MWWISRLIEIVLKEKMNLKTLEYLLSFIYKSYRHIIYGILFFIYK